jgi:anti-sigma B factor antagonist
VLAVGSEVDLAVADQLMDALRRTADAEQVLVDLSACEFLDSTGLAVLVNARNERRDEGNRLALLAPGAQVARLLEVTGLAGDGFAFETIEDARASFAEPPPPA